MQKQQQLKGDKSEKIELCVCRPGRLGARSQVGPEFLHVALHCALTKNIFWNRECRHLALDFAGSHSVQCIFLLMKAEQVPSLNRSGSFVEEITETAQMSGECAGQNMGSCSDNAAELLAEICFFSR